MKCIYLSVLFLFAQAVHAAPAKMSSGPVIQAFGKHYSVQSDLVLPADLKLKVVFDVSEQTASKKENRGFNNLARFLNMHVANGVKAENIELALVVHGKAGYDLLSDAAFRQENQRDNPNSLLLAELIKNNVKIYLCGQSAAFLGIQKADLYPGVQMALSAMTAHAILAQQGYSVNPF
ncbi:DsrE family protein [Pseudoalteromonas tunicata]|nr:DsrE family protein [Pseudoalteromonas tunicata]AXT30671.1 hypothetical protein D1819_07440 [Pseudoalteromonas tunicata]MDP4983343.1 DsrE family protein [Pseudoalteromonas tunicata]MDP5214069.1 DsrE family protein [Pseudoalteromonas tunicata]